MTGPVPRLILAVASFLLGLGGIIHARAFGHASAALAGSNIPPVLSNCFRALWLADSTTLAAVALGLAAVALRPASASPGVVAVLALIPAATAVLIYRFLGPFFAGHLLLGSAAAVWIAALL